MRRRSNFVVAVRSNRLTWVLARVRSLYPDPWADPTSRSTLGFCNLHHRSTVRECRIGGSICWILPGIAVSLCASHLAVVRMSISAVCRTRLCTYTSLSFHVSDPFAVNSTSIFQHCLHDRYVSMRCRPEGTARSSWSSLLPCTGTQPSTPQPPRSG